MLTQRLLTQLTLGLVPPLPAEGSFNCNRPRHPHSTPLSPCPSTQPQLPTWMMDECFHLSTLSNKLFSILDGEVETCVSIICFTHIFIPNLTCCRPNARMRGSRAELPPVNAVDKRFCIFSCPLHCALPTRPRQLLQQNFEKTEFWLRRGVRVLAFCGGLTKSLAVSDLVN